MKGRAALLQPPTFGTINETQDAYLFPLQLRRIVGRGDSSRFWSFHSMPTTVALPGNRFAKSLNGFSDHHDEEDFAELLREYSSLGVPRPSGYADVFHERFHSPRVNWSVNALLAPCLAGGWQDALSPGVHKGTFYKYDMRSAYLWAATLGMPNAPSYQRSLKPWKTKHGIYRIKMLGANENAPFPFRGKREVLATNEEIETYGLQVGEVIDGVTWDGFVDGDSIISTIKLVSTWKQAARAYWGRWGQSQKITCHANGKKWQLPNVALNIPWAHTVIARVKMRLWEAAKRAVHVYIDSVITSEILPIGSDLGAWRLEKTYNGVIIRGPGQYGDATEAKMERFAGVSPNSPQRNTEVALARVATQQR